MLVRGMEISALLNDFARVVCFRAGLQMCAMWVSQTGFAKKVRWGIKL